MLFQDLGFCKPVKWSSVRPSGEFEDHGYNKCVIQDLPGRRERTFEFGVSGGRSVTMKLDLRALETFLGDLREYVSHGTRVDGYNFPDSTNNHCIFARNTYNPDYVQLGVVSIPMNINGGVRFIPIAESVMTIDRSLAAELLGHINTFIAHGSVHPVFKR